MLRGAKTAGSTLRSLPRRCASSRALAYRIWHSAVSGLPWIARISTAPTPHLFKHVPRPAGNPSGGLLDLKAEIRGRGAYLHHLRITARMRRLRINGRAALPTPVTLTVRADWDKRGGWWDIGRAQLDHPGVLDLSISGTLAPGWSQALSVLHIKARVLDLKAAYPLYLQPLLLPAGLGTIETKGSLEIGIEDRSLSDLQLSAAFHK